MLKLKPFVPKTFKHRLAPPLICERIDSETGRLYRTSEGDYPSITTILGDKTPPELEKWRQAVGYEYADEHTALRGRQGSKLHDILEKYTRNDLQDLTGVMPDIKFMFSKVRPFVDEADNFRLIETPLYHDRLRFAGTPDWIAEWRGRNTVGDYKTGKQELREDQRSKYFCQVAAYGMAWNWLYPHDPVEDGVIIVGSIDNGVEVIPFKLADYYTQASDIIREYHLERGTVLQ